MEDYVHSEIQGLLLALDELGRSFGCNRDLYYTLGEYLGYTKAFLFSIEQSQTDPLAWILCSTCTKAQNIASFVYDLEYYFIPMVTMMPSPILSKQLDILQL